MAATTSENSLYLSSDQQDLLLAALTSNSSSSPMFNTPSLSHHISQSISQTASPSQSNEKPEFTMPNYGSTTPPPTAALSGSFAGGTPLIGDLDYVDWERDLDVDGNWDYDLSSGIMNGSGFIDGGFGDTPSSGAGASEHEKRKSPPAEDDDGSPSADPHDTEPKRRESDDKTAKKPGRKPLTSEPTSKRKAQNRAAQRAFRERKEKHLKDLEQKVTELEKASESANHENSILRAQVDRLQTEVKEYRRRLHSGGPQQVGGGASGLFGNKNAASGGFQFEFPMFGGTNNLFNNNNKQNEKNGVKIGPGTLMERLNARPTSVSSNNAKSPTMSDSTTGNINNINSNYTMQGNETSSSQSTPRLNGGRDFASSPSASSVSQHGPGSSCGTSPEPMNNSPTISKSQDSLNTIKEESTVHTAPNGDKYVCGPSTVDGETETTFCEKLSMACGNPHNPIPKAPQFTSENIPNTLDWMTQQNGGNFDPVLFNDYRDPVNDINSTINMSFFDDAFPLTNFPDVGSPHPKKDLLAEIDEVNKDDDEEEVVPAEDPKKMLSCNKIWDRISSHPRFASGELDMDGLCSELRSKAKCSETGVVVAENDVHEVLCKVGVNHKDLKLMG